MSMGQWAVSSYLPRKDFSPLLTKLLMLIPFLIKNKNIICKRWPTIFRSKCVVYIYLGMFCLAPWHIKDLIMWGENENKRKKKKEKLITKKATKQLHKLNLIDNLLLQWFSKSHENAVKLKKLSKIKNTSTQIRRSIGESKHNCELKTIAADPSAFLTSHG